jgi:GT2 family glycosyltransferase
MKMNEITASIVLYNSPEDQLVRLINCVEHSGIFSKLYLIDNSPLALEYNVFSLPIVSYIKTAKNLGYGAAHNVALKYVLSSSEFHFVLNPDIYFEPNELQKMIYRMRQDDSIGQMMPKVIYPDGTLQYLCKLIPTPIDLLFRRFLRGRLKNIAKDLTEKFELRFTGYGREMNIPYLSGCFMLFRISALKKIGLFDERFFMYPEDVDITRRMHMHYRTIFFPEATIIHDHAKESYKSNKMLWIHMSNMIKYFNKWGWIFDAERSEVNKRTLKSLKE